MSKKAVCDIYDCPRNEGGECELSGLGADHPDYTEPSRCTHYKFKKRKKC